MDRALPDAQSSAGCVSGIGRVAAIERYAATIMPLFPCWPKMEVKFWRARDRERGGE
jgi:hypothetical protein